MRCWAVLLVLSGWPLAAGAAQECLQPLLEQLGWRISEAPVAQIDVHGGDVCTRADLEAAHAAGDLRVQLPATASEQARRAMLQRLLEHPATHCAYAMRLGQAARRAAQALQGNPGYRFSGLQLGWIGFGAGGAGAQGWQRTHALGRGYQPSGGNSEALQAFYTGRVRSECGVGRQIAQLATLRELFGDARFDTAFSAGELSIGTFLTLHQTDSVLLGRQAGQLQGDGKGVRAAALGRQAFMGLPGFIEHAYGRDTLDDLNNQAENFIVVDVSAEAAGTLREHGGLAWYDQRNAEIWTLSQQLPRRGVRFFERLLSERDERLRGSLTSSERRIVERLDALLDDPFYQAFLIYVHPRGIQPIGAHVARLLDRNPRTPYVIELAMNNLHTTLYERWLQAQRDSCPGGNGTARLPSYYRPDGAARPRPSTQR